jgi:integrase
MPPKSLINSIGAETFFIIQNNPHKERRIDFNWSCAREKVIWAQTIFFSRTYIINERDKNFVHVKDVENVMTELGFMRSLCESWETKFGTRSLWNLSQNEISELIREKMIKAKLPDGSVVVYSQTTLKSIHLIFSISHELYLQGKISDGINYYPTKNHRRKIMEPLLKTTETSFEEWSTGNSMDSVSPPVASLMLSQSIDILESDKTKAALCFFRAWRKFPTNPTLWFRKGEKWPLDRLERYYDRPCEYDSPEAELARQLKAEGLDHLRKLPWKNQTALTAYCKLLSSVVLNIILTQTGHRISEIESMLSNAWSKRGEDIFIKEAIEKTLGGINIPRHLPKLSAQAAATLWGLSYINPADHALPLFHRCFSYTLAEAVINKEDISRWITFKSKFGYNALRVWLHSYYQNSVIPLSPEIANEQPFVTPHQFRHSWAEFSLRKFDHRVEQKIREQFLHKDERSTRNYTWRKLQDSVKYTIEHNYIREIAINVANGDLSDQYAGPAFIRIRKEIDKLKILYPGELTQHMEELVDSVERVAVFEWGYCILFEDSKRQSQCHDSFTGLPNIEGYSSPERCSQCPNCMHNREQKNNLIRIQVLHDHIAKTHKIKAIAKLSADAVNNISQRLR